MNVANSKVQGAAQDLRNLCPAVTTGSGTVRHRNHTLAACQVRTAGDLPTSCARRGLRQSERESAHEKVAVWGKTTTRTRLHLHVLNRAGARDAGGKTSRRGTLPRAVKLPTDLNVSYGCTRALVKPNAANHSVYCRVEWHNSPDIASALQALNSAYKKLENMRAMPNGENLMASGARALSGRASTSVFYLTSGQYRNRRCTKTPARFTQYNC